MILEWACGRGSRYVCVVPAHSLMVGYRDDAFRSVLNGSALNTPDGMSLVWILKSRGWKSVERVYGPELLTCICESGLNRSLRHYFYGSDDDTLRRLEAKLRLQFPGIIVAGAYSPAYRDIASEEDEGIVRRINMAP